MNIQDLEDTVEENYQRRMAEIHRSEARSWAIFDCFLGLILGFFAFLAHDVMGQILFGSMSVISYCMALKSFLDYNKKW